MSSYPAGNKCICIQSARRSSTSSRNWINKQSAGTFQRNELTAYSWKHLSSQYFSQCLHVLATQQNTMSNCCSSICSAVTCLSVCLLNLTSTSICKYESFELCHSYKSFSPYTAYFAALPSQTRSWTRSSWLNRFCVCISHNFFSYSFIHAVG